ncbi:ATP-dependent helicase, partial [Klebsiella aerogenes]|nr:ATP-dependent helicase [Klebsiella aerogenes]
HSDADKFRELIKSHKSSWIFTSATLSVDEKMSYYTDRLGLENATTLILNSPFDYQHQTLLCVPRYLPPLNQPYTAKRLAAMLAPVILKNQGRCFFLCTSHAMMRGLAEEFKASLPLPVLMQGEMGKSQLLKKFVSSGNAL